MDRKNNRSIGTKHEDEAVTFLRKKGFRIKERNFHCRQGEIDIIGYHGKYLVFVEVKFRSSLKFADPLASVGYNKIRKICKVADYYRCVRGISSDFPIRYDVIGILQNEIVWIQNAFSHRY